MSFPLVRDLAAEGFPVRLTCGVLGFTAQAYYKWLANPVSARDLQDAYLTNALLDAHRDDPAFGYRCLADELDRAGITVGERRVWRLCSQQKLWSTTVRKGRRGKGKPGPAVHDDHVQRNFTAAEPNRTWVTDITEHPTREGKVYCCVVLDAHSRFVAGWSIDSSPTAALVTNALGMAIERRQPRGTVIHSDQGTQFTSWAFTRRAVDSGLLPSMGSVGDCYDNAVIESFWSRMQVELLDRQRWSTRIELANAIFEYLEIFHNRRRRHSALGMLSPLEFESQQPPITAA